MFTGMETCSLRQRVQYRSHFTESQARQKHIENNTPSVQFQLLPHSQFLSVQATLKQHPSSLIVSISSTNGRSLRYQGIHEEMGNV